MSAIALSTPAYSAGDIVVVPFPSSVGAEPKRRPAVIFAVVAYGTHSDYIVCLITSQVAPDPIQLALTQADLADGTLSLQSYLRPAYLYTASEKLIARRIGALAPAHLIEAVDAIIQLIRPQPPLLPGITL